MSEWRVFCWNDFFRNCSLDGDLERVFGRVGRFSRTCCESKDWTRMSGMRQTGLMETLGESSRVGLLFECSLEGLRWVLRMWEANDLIERFFFFYVYWVFLKSFKRDGMLEKKVTLQLEFFIFFSDFDKIIFFFFC